ncbi:MAG TPA: hypothetical protein VHB73_06915 [Alphaproteobacteria bacterium]|nr:hypothetical protein [Alphaproteobacteria bacterium]
MTERTIDNFSIRPLGERLRNITIAVSPPFLPEEEAMETATGDYLARIFRRAGVDCSAPSAVYFAASMGGNRAHTAYTFSFPLWDETNAEATVQKLRGHKITEEIQAQTPAPFVWLGTFQAPEYP